MGIFTILLSFTLILLWLRFLWNRRKFYKVYLQLPGPLGWPFIGLGLEMMHPEKYLQYMEKTARKYKSPFISWMGTSCFLYVNDPETVETIFNSPQCINKGDFYRFMASAIGDGLFTSSVPRWNHHRRLINPAFNRYTLNSFLPIFNAEANTLLEKFHNSECFEMFELLKRSVLETACQTTMGQKMDFQDNGSAAIFNSYNGLTDACVRRMLSPWLYPDVLFKWSTLAKHQKSVVNVLFEFIESLLRRGITINSTKSFGATENNVDAKNSDAEYAAISKSKAIFVEQVRNHVEQGQLTWADVRDEANVIIAASFETTSTALYFVCLCLAIHPAYQDRLFTELNELFPNDQEFTITKEELERMHFTEMVINEAMRLFSPVPMVLRQVTDEVCKVGNVTLPIGTQIGIDIFNMQRSESVWGPQAKQYCPELHFGEEAVKRHPFAFIPFTKGLRMCLGSRYAMSLMKVFIAKIFRNYRLSTSARLEDLIIKGTISLKLAEYPVFQIIKR